MNQTGAQVRAGVVKVWGTEGKTSVLTVEVASEERNREMTERRKAVKRKK